jgi:hypothetical protein
LGIATIHDKTRLLQRRHVSGHGRLADTSRGHQLTQAKLIACSQEAKSFASLRVREGGKEGIKVGHGCLSRQTHMLTMTWIKSA